MTKRLLLTVFHVLACVVAATEVAELRKLRALGSSYRFGGDNGRGKQTVAAYPHDTGHASGCATETEFTNNSMYGSLTLYFF